MFSAIASALKLILALFGWAEKREEQKVGALKQQVADAKAGEKAENEAARARADAATDGSYADKLRDRYTKPTP